MSTATFEKSMDFASLDRAGMQGWVRHALAMAAIVLLGTLLSLAMSGYVPLYNNNAYHLPILTGAYDLPQFQSDPFIQSLRHFSSGFWMLFAGIGKHVDPVLFLGFWMVASRLLFIVASLSVARALGFSGLRFSLAFVGLIATSSLLRGVTVGEGGLNIDYFSHSELANAVILFAFAAALRVRPGLAVFLTCVTFFLNAFMAVWIALPIGLLALYQVYSGRLTFGEMTVRGATGLMLGMPLIAPVLHSILSNPEAGATMAIPYEDFLRRFFPYHFFIDSLGLKGLGFLALLVAGLVVIARALEGRGRDFAILGLGAVLVIAVGAVVPLVTESRFILNLHFMRSIVVIQLLVAVGLAAIAAHWLMQPASATQTTLGRVLPVVMIASRLALPIMLLLVAIRPFLERRAALSARSGKVINAASTLVLLAGMIAAPVLAYTAIDRSLGLHTQNMAWQRAGDWANIHTPRDSLFLLPVMPEQAAPGSVDPVISNDIVGFHYSAERQVWINGKYGAAVMWSPSYLPILERFYEVEALKTTADRLTYARTHGIDYVATRCDDSLAEKPAYADNGLCIYPASAKAELASALRPALAFSSELDPK